MAAQSLAALRASISQAGPKDDARFAALPLGRSASRSNLLEYGVRLVGWDDIAAFARGELRRPRKALASAAPPARAHAEPYVHPETQRAAAGHPQPVAPMATAHDPQAGSFDYGDEPQHRAGDGGRPLDLAGPASGGLGAGRTPPHHRGSATAPHGEASAATDLRRSAARQQCRAIYTALGRKLEDTAAVLECSALIDRLRAAWTRLQALDAGAHDGASRAVSTAAMAPPVTRGPVSRAFQGAGGAPGSPCASVVSLSSSSPSPAKRPSGRPREREASSASAPWSGPAARGLEPRTPRAVIGQRSASVPAAHASGGASGSYAGHGSGRGAVLGFEDPDDIVLEEDEEEADDEDWLRLVEEAEGAGDPERLQPSFSSAAPARRQAPAPVPAASARRALPAELEGDAAMQEALRVGADVFGHRGFRDPQATIVKAALLGLDSFVLMPTGGGKSLCYQLPAVMAPPGHVTVVISPLISLIHDQVQQMKAIGVEAACITGSLSPAECDDVMASMVATPGTRRAANPCMVYVTPERITQSGRFRGSLEALHGVGRLSRFIIDESHCVSVMGHDYRGEYAKLGILRDSYPGVPIMALTATATEEVVADVSGILKMRLDGRSRDPMSLIRLARDRGAASALPLALFRKSFNRPNLRYSVVDKPKSRVVDVVLGMMKRFSGESGIVYTLSRRDAEEISAAICAKTGNSRAAVHYHAGLAPDVKDANQLAWQAGSSPVMAATIAFGMGINKPDTRWVVHASLPKSLANYYQESGRAGRDGEPAECVLVWRHSDFRSQERMILDPDAGKGRDAGPHRRLRTPNEVDSHARGRLASLGTMLDYARDMVKCRREYVLHHFGERFSSELCNGTCDNCERRRRSTKIDAAPAAVGMLELVRTCPRVLTTVQVVGAFRGALKKSGKGGQDRLAPVFSHPMYGGAAGTSFTKDELSTVVQQLLVDGCLVQEDDKNKAGYSTFRLAPGPRAAQFLRPPRRPWLLPLRHRGRVQVTGAAEAKMALRVPKQHAQALERELRCAVAEHLKAEAGGWNNVVSRLAVENASRDVPTSEVELSACEGWGRSRARRLKAVVLPIIRAYLQSRKLAPTRRQAPGARPGAAAAETAGPARAPKRGGGPDISPPKRAPHSGAVGTPLPTGVSAMPTSGFRAAARATASAAAGGAQSPFFAGAAMGSFAKTAPGAAPPLSQV